jgi:hypothetical protein
MYYIRINLVNINISRLKLKIQDFRKV